MGTTEVEAEVREAHGGTTSHPGPAEYVRVAVALAVVTAFEVGLFYIEALPDGALIGLLLALSIIKFSLVVLWFMHLKFDSPVFARFFVAGLAIALVVFGVVLLTFGVFLG